jgi:hypothetical protein
LDARLTTLFCKKENITVPKCKEAKTGHNLAESSKEGYGSERAVLPMMIYYQTVAREYLQNMQNVTYSEWWICCEPISF